MVILCSSTAEMKMFDWLMVSCCCDVFLLISFGFHIKMRKWKPKQVLSVVLSHKHVYKMNIYKLKDSRTHM